VPQSLKSSRRILLYDVMGRVLSQGESQSARVLADRASPCDTHRPTTSSDSVAGFIPVASAGNESPYGAMRIGSRISTPSHRHPASYSTSRAQRGHRRGSPCLQRPRRALRASGRFRHPHSRLTENRGAFGSAPRRRAANSRTHTPSRWRNDEAQLRRLMDARQPCASGTVP